MSTPIQVGERVKDIDIFEIIPPDEGEIDQYYGRIGTGKTMAGTRRIISELKRGCIVYANWKIKWEGYDERKNKFLLFLGVLGFKRKFYFYPKENFHFWKIGDEFIDKLASLTDCNIHLDEGHIPFDSYEATRMSIAKRTAVLTTRHFNRTLVIYSQRPTAIHVTLRANVNRFYKCEVTFDMTLFRKRFIHFLITEFQDLKSGDIVNEDRELDKHGEETNKYKYGISEERYWGTKKLFSIYDSKYLRGDTPCSQPNFAEIYDLSWKERLGNLRA